MAQHKIQEFQDLNTYLYRQIKEMIWSGEIKPGVKIKQVELAERLGVSRTPVLKALHRLASENVVDYVPRYGFYVKKITLEEMIELFELREVLEGVIIKKVCQKISKKEIEELKLYFKPFIGEDVVWDEEKKKMYTAVDKKFHQRLLEISGHSLAQKINNMFNIYRFSYQKGLMRPPQETVSEHLELIKALEAKDCEKAQELIMSHMECSKEKIANIYEKTYES